MANLLSDADKAEIRGEIILSMVRSLAAKPHAELAAEALELSQKVKALCDERYETTDSVRHAEIVAELEKTERMLGVYKAAINENMRKTYGISVTDLLTLLP